MKRDILFVVDNSGSMVDEQDSLAANLQQFIAWFRTLEDFDFHVGVITTQVDASTGPQGNPPRDILPGVLVSAPGRPKIITRETPDLESAFLENISVGTGMPDGGEAGLQAIQMALSAPLVDDPNANAGFLREDAGLFIAIISDGEDQSPDTIDSYIDFFSSIMPQFDRTGEFNREWFLIAAICGDLPAGCQGSGGMADPGGRYIEIAERIYGEFESICATDWHQTLEWLGRTGFSPVRDFPLSRPPLPSSISVEVNGQEVPEASVPDGTDGWTFHPDSNTVCFGDDVFPDYGALIEIRYLVCF